MARTEFKVDADAARKLSEELVGLIVSPDEAYFLNSEIGSMLGADDPNCLLKSIQKGELEKWFAAVIGADVVCRRLNLGSPKITSTMLDNFVLMTPMWNDLPALYKWGCLSHKFDQWADVEQYEYSSLCPSVKNIIEVPKSAAYALMSFISNNRVKINSLLSCAELNGKDH